MPLNNIENIEIKNLIKIEKSWLNCEIKQYKHSMSIYIRLFIIQNLIGLIIILLPVILPFIYGQSTIIQTIVSVIGSVPIAFSINSLLCFFDCKQNILITHDAKKIIIKLSDCNYNIVQVNNFIDTINKRITEKKNENRTLLAFLKRKKI